MEDGMEGASLGYSRDLGGSTESMKTQAETPRSGDMHPEVDNSCSQTELVVSGQGH